jgi:ribosome biogenesis protein MAK21
MGKGNKKSANGPRTWAKKANDDLPSFDENALSALTAKIEKGLGNGKDKSEVQSNTVNGSRNEGKGKKGPKSGEPKPKDKIPELVRGTKRDAHGNAKPNGKVVTKTKSASHNSHGGLKDDRAVLLEEILALGGTEEDLDLVADAFSDEEDEEPKNITIPDKSFRKDLAAFIAGLGIEGAVVEEEEEEEEGEKEELDDEWEEASDVESSEVEAEVEQPLQKADASKPPTVPSSSDPNRLVSTVSASATVLTDSI